MPTEEQEIQIKDQNKITALSTIPADMEARKTSDKDKAIIMVNTESLISVAIGDIVKKAERMLSFKAK